MHMTSNLTRMAQSVLLQQAASMVVYCSHQNASIVWSVTGSNFAVGTGAQPSTALLDCKPSIRLNMPEDVAAVAHGDATLNLQNFMHPVCV